MRYSHSLLMSFLRFLIPATVVCVAVQGANAVVLLDDTWADASRDQQILPAESQWFSSGGTNNLTNVAAGSMTFIADPTASRSAITYFATNGTPISLADGETLKVTLDFIVTGAVTNEAQSMRFGLVDYSAGTRVDADNGSSGLDGANVTGYGFFTHIGGEPFSLREILDIKERTGITSSDLLGSSAAWTNQLAEIWDFDFTPISNNVPYTMTFSVTRSGSDAIVSNRLANSGWSIETNAVHSNGWFNFDAFAFRNSGADETAETFVFTRMKVEGPLGTPSPPAIVGQPQDLVRTVGQIATFNVGASGALPKFYQWYYTTNSTDTLLVNETNTSLSLPSVSFSDAGGYFAVVSNALGSATSDVANLTVSASAPTSPGLIMCDDWADGMRTNTPINATNSLWYASTPGSLLASTGSILGVVAGSRLWVGYFTENEILPVDLAAGNAIHVTLVFTPTNVPTFEGDSDRGVRIGLFDFADGGTRLSPDGFSATEAGGENVLGYMFNIHFYTPFSNDAPIQIQARTDSGHNSLIGKNEAYTSLGSGPGGMLGQPGFQSGVTYTNDITVVRTTLNEVQVTCRFRGTGLDMSHTVTDSTYAVNRFDNLAFRVNSQFVGPEQVSFTKFQVEVIASPVPFEISAIDQAGVDTVEITWDSIAGRTYEVRSTESLLAPLSWTTNASVVATSATTTYTNSGLTSTDLFYQVVDVLE